MARKSLTGMGGDEDITWTIQISQMKMMMMTG